MRTAPLIRQILYHQVAQWCKPPCGTPPCVPTDATGRIAKEWCQEQDQYCRGMPDMPVHDSITWSTKLIKAIWSIFVDVWNACSAHLHTEMENTNNNALDKQVRKAYALEHSMSTSNRLLFHTELTEHLKSSPESK
eukprot:2583651-Ditylum_brightwellii.AAC.1